MVAPPEAFVIGILAQVVAVAAGFDMRAPIPIPFVPFAALVVPLVVKVALVGAGAAWRAAVWVFLAVATGPFHGEGFELGGPFGPSLWVVGVVVVTRFGKWSADPIAFLVFAYLLLLGCCLPGFVPAPGFAARSAWIVCAVGLMPTAVGAEWLAVFV